MSHTVPGRGCRALAIAALSLSSLGMAAAQDAVATVDADGVQRIAIVGGSYFFRPPRIVARAHVPLELQLSVEPGMIPHRFVLEGPAGQPLADLPLGTQTQALRLTLPAGDYPFYCPHRLLLFPSHREHGMAGVLQVRE
ncbi:quinol oxidase [Paenacidovorax monticola]|uniref:Quinol oxidase n=1 Tax=Paenacidovorax monticola TaxID=1926868 RepID=A0A7H0HC21_9BURK|nr:quinol oxidase [Paenacidovorax monticola]QNP58087.1 quinol oxidase [Paenacidovorax monticola]